MPRIPSSLFLLLARVVEKVMSFVDQDGGQREVEGNFLRQVWGKLRGDERLRLMKWSPAIELDSSLQSEN